MKYIPLLCLLLTSSLSYSQPFSEQQVREDLESLVENIKTYNPGLEQYNPNFDAEAGAVIQSVEGETNIFTYFQMISSIVTSSNEGHFYVGSWDDIALKGFLDNVYTYLPLSVKILDNRIYVWSDFSNENTLERGDEILSINGKSTEEILATLRKFIHADGAINTYFIKQAEAGFAWMYYMYVEQASSFVILVKGYQNGATTEVNITPLTVKERNENYKVRYPEKATAKHETSINDLYTYAKEEKYALLTLKSFDYRLVDEFDVDAKELYKEVFMDLQNTQIQNLIIDLRGNTGGRNEFADDMITFILKTHSDPFMKKSVSWHGRKKTYAFSKKSKYAFNGNIYCLVDGKTYSAGATLARYLKEYGEAVCIGEETGSRYEGYVAGSAEAVFLPQSNIKISIPRYLTYYPTSTIQMTTNRGLLPEITIVPTIQDEIEDRDLVMEKVMELMK